MLFLQRGFCAARNTLDATPTDVSDVSKITLQNGIYDDLFLSKNRLAQNTDWDFNTLLHAMFEGNLFAGNVDFTSNQVSMIRVKRREKGTYDWTTLFEVPIKTEQDFIFERFDKYAKSNTDYEYALVPITNNVEGNLNIGTVRSEFDGLFITEKEQSFYAYLDISFNVQKNRSTSVVETLGSKYPFVISNGESNYCSGSISATFAPIDETSCNFLWNDNAKYHNALLNFLSNGKPKIIKLNDGQIWLASITGNIQSDPDGHPQKIKTSFNFTEIGDCDSIEDLYNNNFIDIFYEWRTSQ